MTCCLAIRLDEGIVFLPDTRTSAGVDNISTYRKMHVIQPAPDRAFVIQSAGNLARATAMPSSPQAPTAPRNSSSAARSRASDIQQRFVQHLFEALDELPPIPWGGD